MLFVYITQKYPLSQPPKTPYPDLSAGISWYRCIFSIKQKGCKGLLIDDKSGVKSANKTDISYLHTRSPRIPYTISISCLYAVTHFYDKACDHHLISAASELSDEASMMLKETLSVLLFYICTCLCLCLCFCLCLCSYL